MRMSQLVSSTRKQAAGNEPSRNAELLVRAGFVDRLMAGVYSYLPLGLRVLNHIEGVVRQEMEALGSQELLLPALQPRKIWDQTGRWDTVDVLFKLASAHEELAEPRSGDDLVEAPLPLDLALGPTHEEVVTPLVARLVQSYRDLPISVFQFQTKFRNERRAKSGLLRGREFRMKDMYSFHASQDDLDEYYKRVTLAYHRVFERCGLGDRTLLTFASGGDFSKFSHEFQTLTEFGEDTVFRVAKTPIAINKELVHDLRNLAESVPGLEANDLDSLEKCRSIEVGNIFKLGSRFSKAFAATFADARGKSAEMLMGCYGIGTSRLMGAIAETLSDDRGLIWPREIAPYKYHMISLFKDDAHARLVDDICKALSSHGCEALFDDRKRVSPGQKFADADLIGIPTRLVISEKTLAAGNYNDSPDYVSAPIIEVKDRKSGFTEAKSFDDLVSTAG